MDGKQGKRQEIKGEKERQGKEEGSRGKKETKRVKETLKGGIKKRKEEKKGRRKDIR